RQRLGERWRLRRAVLQPGRGTVRDQVVPVVEPRTCLVRRESQSGAQRYRLAQGDLGVGRQVPCDGPAGVAAVGGSGRALERWGDDDLAVRHPPTVAARAGWPDRLPYLDSGGLCAGNARKLRRLAARREPR